MSDIFNILLLPGDGIGPEVVSETRRVIHWFIDHGFIKANIEEDHVGGAAYDAYGTPLSDETLAKARAADAILLGAVGGPKWNDVSYDKRPEAGLLRLRKELDLFANLRPALVFEALIDASSLKPGIIRGLDIMIVRELSGGVYFGEPRGIEDLGNGKRKGINTQSYTTDEITRIAEVGFELARKRRGAVTSCEKSNVMESGILWREEVTKLHSEHYSDVILEHMYADNCAMQLLRNPRQFDVILTDNLFGDILSDEAAMLTGSLGMLPSASLGKVENERITAALYEPVHGSAPDIAGQDKANPLATILSFGMMLQYSFDRGDLSEMLSQTVNTVLQSGLRTPDIMAENCTEASTGQITEALLTELEKHLSSLEN
jgi:3-isopropylmalate dehydrogenase